MRPVPAGVELVDREARVPTHEGDALDHSVLSGWDREHRAWHPVGFLSAEGARLLLVGKVAVVTGVGPGLGSATALALAREGAAVALAARNEERLAGVAAEIEAAGGAALAVPASVANADDCARVAATAAAELGGIDIVVNSAFRGDPACRSSRPISTCGARSSRSTSGARCS